MSDLAPSAANGDEHDLPGAQSGAQPGAQPGDLPDDLISAVFGPNGPKPAAASPATQVEASLAPMLAAGVHPVVVVIWLDACCPHESTDDLRNPPSDPVLQVSAGWLLAVTEATVTIAQSISAWPHSPDKEASEMLVVPRCLIQKFQVMPGVVTETAVDPATARSFLEQAGLSIDDAPADEEEEDPDV